MIPHNKYAENSIWKYMKKRDYGLKQMASLLGIKSRGHISGWIRGRKLPSLENVLKLAISLNTPPEFLFQTLFLALKEEINARRAKLFSYRKKLHHEA
jgi:transcriptional regulator with XRE-family HTH domain